MMQQRTGTTDAIPTSTLALESADSTVLPEWRERLIRTVAVIALAYGAYWIFWRWTSTMNTQGFGIVPSLVLLVAETWAYMSMCLFVLLTWKLTNRDPGPAPVGKTVDVFITCYDEPLDVVRRTAMGARAIRYPHRTYILDDGKRDEMLAMCEQLGIGYIRRTGNANAKAGNLNHAISVTSGEFILQLDADHVPLPNILDRLLGYFNDPKMAMVQSPQDFYNVDSFTHVVNDEGRRLWEENRIFYSLIQPGRDYWNASFFCGSCGVLRRSAIESIGGFSTKTIIEDMETTLQLHTAGFRTAYHRETLAYGLSPGSASAYHVQRLRWGQGAMQVLRKFAPLTRKGLTLPQRLAYFAGTACYFEGWQKAVFYLMPLFFLFTGILPVAGSETEFLARLIPYVGISILAFELLSRGTGYLFLSERFTMVRVYTYMVAALAIFTTKRLKFNVTPKGTGIASVPLNTYAPQLALLVLSIVAPIWATAAYHQGWVNYHAAGWSSKAFWVNGIWALWNCYFAAYVVRHSMSMRQQRNDHRFAEQLAIDVCIETADTTQLMPAMTADLNPTGLGFRSTRRVEPGTRVSIQLPIAAGLRTTGIVRHVKQEESHLGQVYMHGVAFDALPVETKDQIELYCTQHSMTVWRLRYRQSIDILTRATEVMGNLRSGRRRMAGLPAKVTVDAPNLPEADATGMMILEDISDAGARLVGRAPIPPGTGLQFDVPGTAIAGKGVVRHVQALETPVAVLFSMGVEFNTLGPRPRPWLPSFRRKRIGAPMPAIEHSHALLMPDEPPTENRHVA